MYVLAPLFDITTVLGTIFAPWEIFVTMTAQIFPAWHYGLTTQNHPIEHDTVTRKALVVVRVVVQSCVRSQRSVPRKVQFPRPTTKLDLRQVKNPRQKYTRWLSILFIYIINHFWLQSHDDWCDFTFLTSRSHAISYYCARKWNRTTTNDSLNEN